MDKSHPEKISFIELQDLGIGIMKAPELERLKKDSKKSQQYEIKFIGKEETKTKKVKLPDDMKLKQLKSFLLTLTNNEPFFLKFHMSTSRTVKDLVEKSDEWDKKYGVVSDSKTIEIFLERKEFSLWLRNEKTGEVKEVPGLN